MEGTESWEKDTAKASNHGEKLSKSTHPLAHSLIYLSFYSLLNKNVTDTHGVFPGVLGSEGVVLKHMGLCSQNTQFNGNREIV